MDFSYITDDLLIGSMPSLDGYTRLHELGVRLVLNMRFMRYLPLGMENPPCRVLWLRTIDSPFSPIPFKVLARGVDAALEVIGQGGKVFTHCAYGRHRSVAMGAAILIAQGFTAHAAMDLIKQQRPAADPDIFYIKQRILLFARQWQRQLPA
jgi:protein-tyrosine phosphatase